MSGGESRLSWSIGICAVFAWILILIAANPVQVNGDSAMYLHAGALLLDGRLPYAEIVDNNPPLIMYLSAIPAAVARGLGTNPLPTFLVTVWLLMVASTYATRRLLAAALPECEALHADLLALALAAASLIALTEVEFGQREHLFVAGLFPYLAVRFRTWEAIPTPRWQAVLAGFCLGVVASLKPQFLIIVAAPELYWWATRRQWRALLRPETLAMTAAVAIYVSHFAFVPAVMQTEFFDRWVPFIAAGYHAYSEPLTSILLNRKAQWVPALAAIAIFAWRADPPSVAWRLAPPLAAAAMASGLVFFLQHKGWSYHAVPIMFSAAGLLGLVSARLLAATGLIAEPGPGRRGLRARNTQRVLAGGAGLILLGILVTLAPISPQQLGAVTARNPAAKVVLEHSAKNDPILMISTNVWSIYPFMVEFERVQATRFLYAFQIPVLYQDAVGTRQADFPYASRRATLLAEENRFLNDLRSDLDLRQPKVVLIDASGGCQGCPLGFSVHGYLQSNGFMAAVLSRYRRVEDSGHFATYLPAKESR